MLKICGIRRFEDAEYINEVLPDMCGMILSAGFRRTVETELAARIAEKIDRRIKKVGVFVDETPEYIADAAEKVGLDIIQLHGKEDTETVAAVKAQGRPVWKAVRVKTAQDIYDAEKLGADMLLLDSFVQGTVGGTGVTSDWGMIGSADISVPFFLAGGINADNLPEAMKVSGNIDISGGAETDGVKDREKIRRIKEIYDNNANNLKG